MIPREGKVVADETSATRCTGGLSCAGGEGEDFFFERRFADSSSARDAGARLRVAQRRGRRAVRAPEALHAVARRSIAARRGRGTCPVADAMHAVPGRTAERSVGVGVLADRVVRAARADAPAQIAEEAGHEAVGDLMTRRGAAARARYTDLARPAVAVDAALDTTVQGPVAATGRRRRWSGALVVAHACDARAREDVAVKRAQPAVAVVHAARRGRLGLRSGVDPHEHVGHGARVRGVGNACVVLESKLSLTCGDEKNARDAREDAGDDRAENHGPPATAASASVRAKPLG